MKIVAQINVYNSELYLWYVLKSIYDHVDRIICIDGAFRKTIPTKYSTDNTEKIINDFDDNDDKIVYYKTFSDTQNRQRSKVFKYTDGMDWLLLVDDDEILVEKDLQYMRKYLEETKENCLKIKGYNFVNSFDWFYQTDNMRLWKITNDMIFIGPNSIELINNDSYYNNKDAVIIPKIKRWHYSYVRKPSRLSIKEKQTREYQSGKKFPWIKDGDFVYREIWNREKFTGEHPDILKDHPSSLLKWEPKK